MSDAAAEWASVPTPFSLGSTATGSRSSRSRRWVRPNTPGSVNPTFGTGRDFQIIWRAAPRIFQPMRGFSRIEDDKRLVVKTQPLARLSPSCGMLEITPVSARDQTQEGRQGTPLLEYGGKLPERFGERVSKDPAVSGRTQRFATRRLDPGPGGVRRRFGPDPNPQSLPGRSHPATEPGARVVVAPGAI